MGLIQRVLSSVFPTKTIQVKGFKVAEGISDRFEYPKNDLEWERFRDLCESNGLKAASFDNGTHWQARNGKVLVNFWPKSRTRTIHVGGTTKNAKIYNGTVEKVISLALGELPRVHKKARPRRYSNAERKVVLYSRHGKKGCFWCKKPMSVEEATLDHKIPLARGGMDNYQNIVLSCEPCNKAKGDSIV